MNEISQSSSEVPLLNPEIGEHILRNTTLYHGSPSADIAVFEIGEDGTTLGDAIYFVDNPVDASGYARRRSTGQSEAATLYEVLITEARLVNLDDQPTREALFNGYNCFLADALQDTPPDNWLRSGRIVNAMNAIRAGQPERGNIRSAVYNTYDLFTSYVKSLGYDGVKAWEGGEGGEVGPHETYLIFDPQKIVMTGSRTV